MNVTNNNNSGSKYQYQTWPRKSTTARGEDGEEVVEDEELENDEEEIDNTIDEREEEEYFYETNRIRKFNGGEIVISATSSSSPLPSTTSLSSVSTNSSTYPITANDTNTNTTSSFTSTTTKRIVSQTSYKVLGEASRSSGTYRKTLAKETANKNKLLTTFAEPLFALHHPSSLGALVSDYVFKIRILTEDNIQLSEFELNVSCKRMSSTSAIDNGINGNYYSAESHFKY